MTKTFKTDSDQTRRVNDVIDRYRKRVMGDDPEAKAPSDVDALMAFVDGWDYKDAARGLPGASDLFRAFDTSFAVARETMAAVARLVVTEREAARRERADEIDMLTAKVDELTAELAEVRTERDALRDELAAKDATVAELTAKVEQGEAMAAMVAKVTAYVDATGVLKATGISQDAQEDA